MPVCESTSTGETFDTEHTEENLYNKNESNLNDNEVNFSSKSNCVLKSDITIVNSYDVVSSSTTQSGDNCKTSENRSQSSEDIVNCETNSDNLVSDKSSVSSTSPNNPTTTFKDNQVESSTENSNIRNEESSNDNCGVQNTWSSEAESCDSRYSGSSAGSNSQSEHKKKFGKFRILDTEFASNGLSTIKQSNDNNNILKDNEEKEDSKIFIDQTTDDTTINKDDLKQNEQINTSSKTLNSAVLKNSDLSSQVAEKDDSNNSSCEETTARRRSSRIRSIAEKKEKEQKETIDKGKKGKTNQKVNSSEKRKQEKQKEDKAQPEKKIKEEQVKKPEEKPIAVDKKDKKPKTKGNNTTKGKNVKIVDVKQENNEETKQCKSDTNVLSPIQSVSSSPKYEGRKEHDDVPKPEKVKSRWRRNSELERGELSGGSTPTYIVETNERNSPVLSSISNVCELQTVYEKEPISEIETDEPSSYLKIEENIYLFERRRSKCKKEVRRMVCDCSLTKEEKENNIPGCGEDCLNRLLMIECGSRCATGDACTNKRFQKKEYARTENFKTAKKGWGLRTLQDLQKGVFVMEYVGEVLSPQEFKQRVKHYAREKTQHHYFMALKNDEIIDATYKGNLSRFINHSCDPNCETQKWTVNGELRIGFFTRRAIAAGEELTFDYQFQRYGKEAQKCFCESRNCRGFIGDDDKQLELKPSNRNLLKRRKALDERKREIVEDLALEDEIKKLTAVGGLRNREQTLMLARLMVRAEDNDTRHHLLDIIENTAEQACLRLFLDYHGLSLLWSWMVDIGEEAISLKIQILRVLTLFPISNKTMLLDSKVMSVVERWSKQIASQKLDHAKEVMETEPVNVDLSQIEHEQLIKKNKLSDDNASDSDSSSVSPSNVESENAYTAVNNRINSTSLNTSLGSDNDNNKTLEFGGAYDNVQHEKGDTNLQNSIYGQDKSSEVERMNDECRDIMEEEDERRDYGVATMAFKLLEAWSGLKEVFRIPRLEKQKRREDEQEVDRHEEEYSRNFRNQDQDWSQSRDRHNTFRDKPYRERYREFDKTNVDNIDQDRKHLLDSPEWREERWNSKSNRKPINESEESVRPRKGPLLPTPPRVNKLSKAERRHLFALEVQQRDEETLRRQQEQFDNQYMYDNNTYPQNSFSHDGSNFSHDSSTFSPYFQMNAQPLVQQISNISDTQLQYPDEQLQYTDEQMQYPDTQMQYPDAEMQYPDTQTQYSDTQTQYPDTQTQYPDTQTQYPDTQTQYPDTQTQYPDAQSQYPDTQKPYHDPYPDMQRPYPDAQRPYSESQRPFTDTQMQYADMQMQVSTTTASPPPRTLMIPETSSESPVAPVARAPLLPTPTPNYVDSPHQCPQVPLSVPPPNYIEPSHQCPQPPLSVPPPNYIEPSHNRPQAPLPAPAPTYMESPRHCAPLPPPTSVSVPASYTEQPGAIVYPPPPPSGIVYPPPPAQLPYPPRPTVSLPAPPPPINVQTAPTIPPSPYIPNQSRFISPAQQVYYVPPPTTVPIPEPTPIPVPHTTNPPPAVPIIHHIPSTSTVIEESQYVSSSPPKTKAVKLPPNWKTAKDGEGNTYYYHAITRQTQWDPPTSDDPEEDMDLGTPTYDEPKPSKKKGTTTAAADTSSEVAKKIRELFRTKMSSFIVQCLNPYRKPDSKYGRITSTEDFKHLARKLTHFVMAKELKHCRNVEDLECNDNVKHKAKDFIHKYMAKFGSLYRKDKLSSPKDD